MNKFETTTDLITAAKEYDSESFTTLFQRYSPIVYKLWHDQVIYGMELEDWKQESRIILMRSIKQFDPGISKSFGSFYKQGLKNFKCDLIRKLNAQKRIPISKQVPINPHHILYTNAFLDKKACLAENKIMVNEVLLNTVASCSLIECRVLLGIVLYRLTPEKMAEQWREYSMTELMNAHTRCKIKYKKEIDRYFDE